jgi:hypothetical protein
MTTKTKPWYKRRRYWTLAILAVLVYFCLIPSPLRVSPETTGITEPLLPNGDVDYFGAFEQTYIHKLNPPEDNGQRLLIAACGPRVLEQTAIVESVPWEEIQTHKISKHWFEEQWLPLCEHMYIDPYAKPRFLDNLDFHSFLRKEWEANKKDDDEKQGSDYYRAADELRQKLAAAPWTAEEYPNIAQWLEERSPVLDLFGVAVRKPNFACYRWRPESGSLGYIMLSDIQAQRQFARELHVRITERLGKGDVDGAWYDVMSMFYLSRKHYIHDSILVVNLVGIAIEGVGWEAAKLILQYGNPSSEQLERFAKDLDSLPRKMTLYSESEHLMAYSLLSGGKEAVKEFLNTPAIFSLPYDRNIAGKRLAGFYNIERKMSSDAAWYINRTVMKEYIGKRERSFTEKQQRLQRSGLKSVWNLMQIPLIRTRSPLIADALIVMLDSGIGSGADALARANTQLDLLRMATALERYKSAKGNYPSDLEALVPRYLEEVPLDSFMGRKTFGYKLAPDSATAVLLHSSEWDETSTNSRKKKLYIRIAR